MPDSGQPIWDKMVNKDRTCSIVEETNIKQLIVEIQWKMTTMINVMEQRSHCSKNT